jgi:hypothetical protein
MNLLRTHYGPHSIQMVPDRDRGDLGIEAYSPSDGCLFQCYAAEEPLTTDKLYESQRGKLTKDLGKLKKKQDELAAMLGTMFVKKYVFMVPRHDSRRLLAHATTKAAEVVGWNLAFIAPELRIVVVTDDDYPQARNALFPAPAPLVSYLSADDQAIAQYRIDNDSLVSNARQKLVDAGITEPLLDTYLDGLLLQFVEGENALAALRDTLPDQWQTAQRCRSTKEKRLVLEHPTGSNSDARTVVNAVMHDLTIKLRQDAPALNDEQASTIAYASVADWLMRCPLTLGAAS